MRMATISTTLESPSLQGLHLACKPHSALIPKSSSSTLTVTMSGIPARRLPTIPSAEDTTTRPSIPTSNSSTPTTPTSGTQARQLSTTPTITEYTIPANLCYTGPPPPQEQLSS